MHQNKSNYLSDVLSQRVPPRRQILQRVCEQTELVNDQIITPDLDFHCHHFQCTNIKEDYSLGMQRFQEE